MSEGTFKRWDALGTNISWCHFVWNWWVGCSEVSAGCANCYARTFADHSPAAFFHKQSAAFRNETGVKLDGQVIHEYPTPRSTERVS